MTLPYEQFVPGDVQVVRPGGVGDAPAAYVWACPPGRVVTGLYYLLDQLDEYARHFAKIQKLADPAFPIRAGVERPNELALTSAVLAVGEFKSHGVPLSKVIASGEGGIAVCIVSKGRYADIECLNSGTILAVISDKNSDPLVWEVEPEGGSLAVSVDRIKKFVNA